MNLLHDDLHTKGLGARDFSTDNAYSFKVPTDKELQESTIWSGNMLEDPMSVNNLIGNYEAMVPTNTTWRGSLMNLNPFNSLYIVSTELSDFHYSAPDGYSNSIIKKSEYDV